MVRGGDYLVWAGVCSDREREDVVARRLTCRVAVNDADPARSEIGLFCNRAEWEIRQIAPYREVHCS